MLISGAIEFSLKVAMTGRNRFRDSTSRFWSLDLSFWVVYSQSCSVLDIHCHRLASLSFAVPAAFIAFATPGFSSWNLTPSVIDAKFRTSLWKSRTFSSTLFTAEMNLPMISADCKQAVATPTHDATIEIGSPMTKNQQRGFVFCRTKQVQVERFVTGARMLFTGVSESYV